MYLRCYCSDTRLTRAISPDHQQVIGKNLGLESPTKHIFNNEQHTTPLSQKPKNLEKFLSFR